MIVDYNTAEPSIWMRSAVLFLSQIFCRFGNIPYLRNIIRNDKDKMRKLALLLLLCPLTMMAENRVVQSPDGRMKVKVSVEDGIATYAVAYDGEEMLCPSRLGLQSNIGDFTKGLTFVVAKESKVEKHYDMTRTTASHVDFMANQLEVTLADAKQKRTTIRKVPSSRVRLLLSFSQRVPPRSYHHRVFQWWDGNERNPVMRKNTQPTGL